MGRCKTCTFYRGGWCTNEEKIHENMSLHGEPYDVEEDHLVFEFFEGGGFLVGPKFGCIHHASKQSEDPQG